MDEWAAVTTDENKHINLKPGLEWSREDRPTKPFMHATQHSNSPYLKNKPGYFNKSLQRRL